MSEVPEHPENVIGKENETTTDRFDAVVVHGFGIEKKQTQIPQIEGEGDKKEVVGYKQGSIRFEPKTDGKMRAIAAAELVIEGKTDLLIFSGGQTYKEENSTGQEGVNSQEQDKKVKPPTEAKAMEDYTKRLLRLEIRRQLNKLKNTDDEGEQREIRRQIYRLDIDNQDPIQKTLDEIEKNFHKETDPEKKRKLRQQEVRLRRVIDIGDVNKITIHREEESIDTSTNLERTISVIRDNGWDRVLYFTNRYHTARVKKLVELMYHKKQITEDIVEGFVIPDTEETLTGLKKDSFFGTKEIHGGRRSSVRERSGRETQYRPLVNEFYRSPGMLKRKAIEAGNRMLLMIDPDAKIAKKLAERFRQEHKNELETGID